MTLFTEVRDIHEGTIQTTKAESLLKLLKKQAVITKISASEESLYIRYEKTPYFNFGDITCKLFNEFGLIVGAFDRDPDGIRNIWLRTVKYAQSH